MVRYAALLTFALAACHLYRSGDDDGAVTDGAVTDGAAADGSVTDGSVSDGLAIDAATTMFPPLRIDRCDIATSALDFPMTALGQLSMRTVRIVNDSALTPFVRWRIEPAGTAFQVDPPPPNSPPLPPNSRSLGPGESIHIDVRFAPTSVGPASAELVVEQQAFMTPPMAPQRIQLTATAVAAPNGPFAITGNLDFTLNPDQRRQLDIRNNGAAPVRFFPPQVSEHFRMNAWGCPDELAPGASCPVFVDYLPTAAGCHTGTFTLPTSVGDVTVGMSGPAMIGRVIAERSPGSAVGTITSNPAGLNCPSYSCSGEFQPGEQVTLTANTAVFGGWNEPECGLSPTCTVSADVNVVSELRLRADMVTGSAHNIVVTIEGEGEVTSIGPPPYFYGGVTCRSSCVMPVATGSPVTLIATGKDVFGGWSGACSGDGTCELLVDRDRAVTATFSSALGSTTWTLPSIVPAGEFLPSGEILTGGHQRQRLSSSGAVVWGREVMLWGRTPIGFASSGDGGSFELTHTFTSHILYRFDADGDEMWSRRWPLGLCGTVLTTRDRLVVTGGRAAFVAGEQLIVVDATDGTDEWSALVPGCHAIAADPGGMIGVSRRGATLDTHVVRRYAADGQVLGPDLPVPGFGVPAIAFDAVAALITHNAYGGAATIARQAGDGSVVFSLEELAGAENLALVAVAADGSIIATHGDVFNGNPTSDTVLRRYAPDGTQLSTVTWPSSQLGSSRYNRITIHDIATDSTGRVLLTGSASRAGRARLVTQGWMASFTVP